MKDEYFTTNYTSPGWQKVNDSCYFLIKTGISNAAYETEAFVLCKDDYTIKVYDYSECDGILSTIQRNIKENMDNTWGTVIATGTEFAVDFTLKFIESGAKAAVAGFCPAGEIIVKGYDGFCLLKEGIETFNNGTLFSTVSYLDSGFAEVGTYVIEFELAKDLMFDEATKYAGVSSTILGWAEKIYDKYLEKEQIEQQNLDTYGNKDVALQTFSDSIKKAGFSSDVYDTGLNNIVSSFYGE